MANLKNYWRIINVGYFLRYHPYFYSKKKRMVLFNPSKKIHRGMIISICMVIAYEIFMAYQAFQVQNSEDVGQVEKIRSVSITVIYILFNFNHIITLKHYGQHHICINAFFKVTGKIKERAGVPLTKSSRKAERSRSIFVILSGSIIFVVAIARALRVFAKPMSREMLSSIAKNPKMLPVWIKIPLALLHFHLALFHAYFMVMHGCSFWCYCTEMVTVILQIRASEAKMKGENGPKTNSEMTTIMKNYTELSVLQSFFSSIYGIWPLGFEIAILFYSIIHIVLAVVFQEVRYGIFGVVSCLLLLGMFSNYAELHSLSEDSIHSWKIGILRQSWFAKFHRSCRPLKIYIGNFYYADRQLLLTIISIIIDNVTSLIISYKDTH